MAREYGVDNGDGTITVWGTDDAGNFWPIRTESRAINQGQVTGGGGGTYGVGGGTYQTREGPKTESQLRSELSNAGYGGPWDANSMLAAFERAGGGAGGNSLSAYNAYLQAMTGTNREQFNAQLAQQQSVLDFDKKKWAESLGWEKDRWAQQYALDQAKFGQSQVEYQGNLGTNLAQIDASLRGPENYASDVQFKQLGRSLYNALFGSKPVAAFGMPTGYSAPASIESVLRDLGLLSGSGSVTAQQQATGLQNVPLPYQIHPAVMNSLSDTAKKMMFSLAGKGYTESGVWNPEDYRGQYQASLPQGIAPRNINYQWQQPQSYYG